MVCRGNTSVTNIQSIKRTNGVMDECSATMTTKNSSRRQKKKKKLCGEFKSKKIRRLLQVGSVMWCAKCNVTSRLLSCKIFVIVVVPLLATARSVLLHVHDDTLKRD